MKLPVRLSHSLKPCGLFGAVRKYDIHAGLDLYAECGNEVISLTAGTVTQIKNFTGEYAGSPWWNNTQCVVISCDTYDIVYGEIAPCSLKIGQYVSIGDIIGHVNRVLKLDKGITPTSMLHLEVWEKDTSRDIVWELGEIVPSGLIDPRQFFKNTQESCLWLIKTKCGYKLEDNLGNYLIFFSMAADSKAYCQSKQLDYILLKQNSSLENEFNYYIATGKLLWWNKI